MQININRLMQSMEAMWQLGATPNGGVDRLALTDDDRDARDLLRQWCEDAGLTVRVDDFGNMVARREGSDDLPPVLIGSHTDTVPKGGRYDGSLGILAGLEVVRSLNDAGIITRHPIEIVNWTAEEGSRFRPSLLGSRGALGHLDSESPFTSQDANGVDFGEELARIGYAGEAANRPTEATAYLELHIEQGPVLESEDLAVGLVQGIIGQTVFDFTVRGRAGHAGALPMHLRADALAAAARMITETQRLGNECEDYGVATVGQLSVTPGAINVVPSLVTFTVDARCATLADMAHIREGLHTAARAVEAQEGVTIEIAETEPSESRPFNDGIMATIREAMVAEGLPARELWSGAGHDAGPAALHWPSGMIFVRSKDGLSHAEAEYSSPEDIAKATAVLMRTAVALAR